MRKRSGQVHSRESSATLQLTVSLLYRKFRKMYTDILQNDIIIISKKIKQRIESVLLDTKKKTIFIQ